MLSPARRRSCTFWTLPPAVSVVIGSGGFPHLCSVPSASQLAGKRIHGSCAPVHQPGSPLDDAVGALQFATWDRQEEQPERAPSCATNTCRALLTSTKVVAVLTPALFFRTASVSLALLWLEQREAVGRSKAQGTGSSQGRLLLQQPDAAGTRDKALGTWGPQGTSFPRASWTLAHPEDLLPSGRHRTSSRPPSPPSSILLSWRREVCSFVMGLQTRRTVWACHVTSPALP